MGHYLTLFFFIIIIIIIIIIIFVLYDSELCCYVFVYRILLVSSLAYITCSIRVTCGLQVRRYFFLVLSYTWKMSPVARGAMFVSKMDVVEVVTGAISLNLVAFTLVVVMAVVIAGVSSVMSDVVGTC